MLGAFAFGLIFGRDPNPYPNDFCPWFVHIPYSDWGISRLVSSFSGQVNDCNRWLTRGKKSAIQPYFAALALPRITAFVNLLYPLQGSPLNVRMQTGRFNNQS